MSNDAKIQEYRSLVESKREQLGQKPKMAYITNALIPLNDNDRINLNTLSTEEACVDVTRSLLMRRSFDKLANRLLGTNVESKIGGFTVHEWIKDIKLRVQAILWEKKKKQLTAMDTKLKALMSDDAKTADAIKDIASLLGDI